MPDIKFFVHLQVNETFTQCHYYIGQKQPQLRQHQLVLFSSLHLEIEGLKDDLFQVELLIATMVVLLIVVDLQTMVHSIEKQHWV